MTARWQREDGYHVLRTAEGCLLGRIWKRLTDGRWIAICANSNTPFEFRTLRDAKAGVAESCRVATEVTR